MKKIMFELSVILILLTAFTAFGKEYFVSPDGVDDASRDGSYAQPFRQVVWALNQGIFQSGDTLTAMPGVYSRMGFYTGNQNFDPENPVLVRSQQIHKAQSDGFNVGKMTGMIWDGFDIGPGAEGQNAVQIQGANTHSLLIRNFLIHDAAPGGDCLKINNYAHDIVVEGCEIYNPGDRSTGGFPTETWQENIDLYGSDNITIRKCWLYHIGERGDHIAYTKGLSHGNIFEYNVIGPQATLAHEGALSAGSRSTKEENGFVAFDVTMRGNVMIDCGYSAIGVFPVKGTRIVDNIIYNCGYRPSPIDPEPSAPITFRVAEGATPDPQYRSFDTLIEGNVFVGLGQMGAVAIAPQDSTEVDSLVTRNNTYYNAGAPISAAGVYDPNLEEGASFMNPGYEVPAELELDKLDYGTIWNWFHPDEKVAAIDFNGDGTLSISDAIAMLQFQRSNPGDLRGDYNKDGQSNISDVIQMLIVMMGFQQ